MINPIVAQILAWLFLTFLFICLFSLVFSVLSFAPWVPARSRDLKRIFALARLKPGQIFYDLGCGDGKTIFYAAKNFQAQAIGLEISLLLYLFCRLKNLFYGWALFKFKNLYNENLSKADVVYFFGMPGKVNLKFKKKLLSELKPGAKVISYAFGFPDWRPETVDKPSEKDLPIYLYEI